MPSAAYVKLVEGLPRAPSPGMVAVITGGSTGLGFESARALLQVGYDVVMANRNEVKTEKAIKDLEASFQDVEGVGSLFFVKLDLLEQGPSESIETFPERLTATIQGRKIDILLCNAGLMAPAERRVDANGIETQFSGNHLGHFKLVYGLLPLIHKDHGRIVSVSSIAGAQAADTYDFTTETVWDIVTTKEEVKGSWLKGKWDAYQLSKHANLAFAKELSRQLDACGSPITVACTHPGMASSDLTRDLGFVMRAALSILQQKTDLGAIPQIYACLGTDVKNGDTFGPKGMGEFWGKTYVKGGRLEAAYNKYPEVGSLLWKVSEKLTGLDFDVAKLVR